MSFQNETAIITGSTSGIGKKLAELLLKEGCKVTICSRSEEKVKKTLAEFKKQFGDSVIGFPCDVSKHKDVENIVKKTIEAFGSVRILIANAGVNTIYGPFANMTPKLVEEHAKTVLGVNLIGLMNTISATLPQMKKQKYGRIITLSGGGADRPLNNMTLYSASKGGVVTFSKCLATEFLDDEDIKLNIYQPGMIKTNLASSIVCVPNWRTKEELHEDTEFVLSYLGVDLDESCSKVIPYVMPECKSNGEVFRGFKLFPFIMSAMRLQKAMKKRNKQRQKQ